MPESAAIPVSDAAVPEGHVGLHKDLYGEGQDASAVHDVPAVEQFQPLKGEDDGTALVEVGAYLGAREQYKFPGVYALYNAGKALQYVGYSRNVPLAVKAHLTRVGGERCTFVKASVFKDDAILSRAALESVAEEWLQRETEPGQVPPGNGSEQAEWEGKQGSKLDASLLPAESRQAHEEKKAKLQKAMGEKKEPEVVDDPETRRLKTIAAMEGGDWSAEIDAQTRETIQFAADAARARTEAAASASGASAAAVTSPGSANSGDGSMVSPFTKATVHRSIGSAWGAGDLPPMTVESVDQALEEVRPYLVADGGNVTVVSVNNGMVLVEMQGACGTCAASSATLKMGIETSLKAAFGDQLKEVVAINPQVDGSATVEAVDSHLDMLRPAITSYGGSVTVLEVGSGVARLKYVGPAAIGMGIKAAVKDKFPDVREVVLVEE